MEKKTPNPTNGLFAMTRYRDAYTKHRVTRRWNHGPSEYCIDGWVPNTFLVGSDTAGMNGRNEMTKLKREYPDYFETIDRKDFQERYSITRYLGTANYDYNRIRPEKRDEWIEIVRKIVVKWVAKHGALKW